MIKKRSDIILLFILLLLIFLIYIGTPNAKATYNLKPKDIVHYKNKANGCDMEAIQKLIAHYAVNSNKLEFNKWRKKEKICSSKLKPSLAPTLHVGSPPTSQNTLK